MVQTKQAAKASNAKYLNAQGKPDLNYDPSRARYRNNEDQSADGTSVTAKRKSNRPDLQNFGAENVEAGDNSRYLRHAMAGLDLPPIDISDDKQVAERLDWYFNHCIEDDMKPTVTGMANCLGIDKTTLWSWRTGECRAKTHSPLIKKAYKLLEELWESYMLNGKVNPASGIFLGRNHWGYQDKVEVVVGKSEDSDSKLSMEDMAARYMVENTADADSGVETTFAE